jgi:hypothetical protein
MRCHGSGRIGVAGSQRMFERSLGEMVTPGVERVAACPRCFGERVVDCNRLGDALEAFRWCRERGREREAFASLLRQLNEGTTDAFGVHATGEWRAERRASVASAAHRVFVWRAERRASVASAAHRVFVSRDSLLDAVRERADEAAVQVKAGPVFWFGLRVTYAMERRASLTTWRHRSAWRAFIRETMGADCEWLVRDPETLPLLAAVLAGDAP